MYRGSGGAVEHKLNMERSMINGIGMSKIRLCLDQNDFTVIPMSTRSIFPRPPECGFCGGSILDCIEYIILQTFLEDPLVSIAEFGYNADLFAEPPPQQKKKNQIPEVIPWVSHMLSSWLLLFDNIQHLFLMIFPFIHVI